MLPPKGQSGQALVEGAFVLLLLFVLIFAVFEGGRFLQVQHTVTDAAREGARRSIAPFTKTSTLASVASVEDVVKGYLRVASLDPALATITVDQAVVLGSDPTQYTRVTVVYPYRLMTLGMFWVWNRDITGTSLMRNETSP